MNHHRALLLSLAALSLLLATIAGAVGSHALAFPDDRALRSFETAVQFQFFHGLGVLAIVLLGLDGGGGKLRAAAAWLMIAGALLFCGSIYARAFGTNPTIVSAAPYGGVAFMLAWLAVAASAWLDRTRPADHADRPAE
jgi:uncharacterized membrane protein YgdD (TMEM256/DUF423 family)